MTVTTYDFDTLVPRRGTGNAKWEYYDADVLPLWVADMDFRSPQPVIEALHRRAEHGYFGYDFGRADVKAAICERMMRLYQWDVKPEQIMYLAGIVSGLNVTTRAIGERGDGVLVQTPVYPPFLSAAPFQHHILQEAPLKQVSDGQTLRYEIDFEVFEASITPQTRLFILCNPHNPIGRAYTSAELKQLADICQRHNVVICSDEIHSDLMLDGRKHTPLASLSPEIGQNAITLMAPSKTYNLPGLYFGFAIVQNPELMKQMQAAAAGIMGSPNVMGFEAALAAYKEGQPWLDAALAYLAGNRDFLENYIKTYFPKVRMTHNEATYLAWVDWNEAGLPGNPQQFFLEKARVALNDGAAFGKQGEGFTRINFASPRSMLTEALERMRATVESLV